MGLASPTLRLRALAQLPGDPGGRLLRRLERPHCPVRLRPFVVSSRARLGRTARGIVPANMSREDEGLGQLFAGRQARRLLLRLGREPAGLRPELAEDVLDAGEVRLRLDELVLCLAPPPLMATDAGDLLEQRAALLGAKG